MEEKKKGNLEEKLKTERASEVSPSPILSSLEQKKSSPLLIVGICLGLSVVLNVVLGVLFFSNISKTEALESEIEKNQKTIQELRVNLNNLENEKSSR